ncbi:MAG: hypothetical protein II550_06255, partial [Ruminococcus sp.]|nr:hypothetical protein [Ruminococcus sp.]
IISKLVIDKEQSDKVLALSVEILGEVNVFTTDRENTVACFTRVQMRNPLQENKTTSDTASVKGTVSEAVLLFS